MPQSTAGHGAKDFGERITLALFACLVVGVAGSLYVVFKGSGTAGEIIEVELGDVTPDAKIVRTIGIPNATGRALTIRSISKDCACVLQEVDRNSIAPGECAELKVQYTAPTMPGPVQYRLAIAYHESTDPTLILITGTVVSWAEFEPRTIEFSDAVIGTDTPSLAEVSVKVKEPWPASERDVKFEMEHGRLLSERVERAGSLLVYRLALGPGTTARIGEYRGEFVLRWTGKEDRVVRVPCIGRVVPGWSARPTHVFFGVVPKGTSQRIDLTISNRAGKTGGALTRARVTHDLASAFQVKPVFPIESSKGGSESIVVTLILSPNQDSPTGFLSGQVTVLSPDGGMEVRVPVSALVQ